MINNTKTFKEIFENKKVNCLIDTKNEFNDQGVYINNYRCKQFVMNFSEAINKFGNITTFIFNKNQSTMVWTIDRANFDILFPR